MIPDHLTIKIEWNGLKFGQGISSLQNYFFLLITPVVIFKLSARKFHIFKNYNSCGYTGPFAHGKVRPYPREVCVLCVTSIPTVKLPMRNRYGYIKKNKRITHDVFRSKS